MTRVEDVRVAVEAGADAVGCLVGVDGAVRDAVDPDVARELFAALPPEVESVLVTHRTTVAEVLDLVRRTGARVAQLHGPFPLDAIPELRRAAPQLAIVRCAHIVDEASVETALRAAEAADAVLLDTRTADRIGGTGQVHDWGISARIVARSPRPVILAGGLTPENVAGAIARVKPHGVDVNTGVRAPDGGKSHDRIRAFVAAARDQGMR